MSDSIGPVQFEPPVPETGEPLRPIRDYGIGIDCHSRFIVVSVLVADGQDIRRFERQFSTVWYDLLAAKRWLIELLGQKLATPPIPGEIEYTLESTACYHLPVIQALNGVPHVINPTLAGGSRRKTDALDSRLMAWQDMSGLWPRSYVVPPEIQAIRATLLVRRKTGRAASTLSARAGSMLLKFGHTFHIAKGLTCIENRLLLTRLMEGDPTLPADRFPQAPLPDLVRQHVPALLAQRDELKEREAEVMKSAYDACCAVMWPTQRGPVAGVEMLKYLKSVPGCGDVMAITWLAEISDPRRTRSTKTILRAG